MYLLAFCKLIRVLIYVPSGPSMRLFFSFSLTELLFMFDGF